MGLTFVMKMNQDFGETDEGWNVVFDPDAVVMNSILKVFPGLFSKMTMAMVKNITISSR